MKGILLVVALWGASTHAADKPARGASYVTVQSYNQLVSSFRAWVARVTKMEQEIRELKGKLPSQGEEAVDLGALDAAPPSRSAPKDEAESQAHSGRNPHAGSGNAIRFKVLFDLNFYHRPGIADLTFDNFHAFLMAEALPNSQLQFQFDVNPTPRWYELDYTPWSWLTLRAGKIWIPFDDLSPHNVFGGRVNTSRIMPEPPFLPNLWADLGVGVKLVPLDSRVFRLTVDAYTTNGFGAGGTDPTGSGTTYPSFADSSLVADNNREKSLGGRVHGDLLKVWGLGASIHWGRWSKQSDSAHYATILGADTRFRIEKIGLELRAGLAAVLYDLPGNAAAQNVGTYGEAGWSFWKRRFKVLARAGTLQIDDRTINTADMLVVGGAFLFRWEMIEIGLEYSRDLMFYAPKKNYDFANLRLVVLL